MILDVCEQHFSALVLNEMGCMLIICSLHCVHKMNAYMADCVCLSIHLHVLP
jgi:hypothetical protein